MTKEELEDEYCQMNVSKFDSFEDFLVDLIITFDGQIEKLTKSNDTIKNDKCFNDKHDVVKVYEDDNGQTYFISHKCLRCGKSFDNQYDK